MVVVIDQKVVVVVGGLMVDVNYGVIERYLYVVQIQVYVVVFVVGVKSVCFGVGIVLLIVYLVIFG